MSVYRLLRELFLPPQERTILRINTYRSALESVSGDIGAHIDAFLADRTAWLDEEYGRMPEWRQGGRVALGCCLPQDTHELCERGTRLLAGLDEVTSLTSLYDRFSFEVPAGQRPDSLPVMIDFARASRVCRCCEETRLRRCYLERCLQTPLIGFRQELERRGSVYALSARALELCIDVDLIGLDSWAPRQSSAKGVGGQPT